ncbi:MAG: mechanosensitive ion channel family protein [Alphaproteobacteria bacterium]
MYKDIDLSQLLTTEYWLEWAHLAQDILWESGGLIQLIVLGAAFFMAVMTNALTRKRVIEAIENQSWPETLKAILLNARRNTTALFALIFIFIGSRIMAADFAGGLDTSFNSGVMKVLMAWIAIRLALQFIQNHLLRNIFALTIWIIVALSIFGVLDQTIETLDSIGFNIGTFRLSVLNIIKGLISVTVVLYAAILASGFFERKIYNSRSLTRSSQVLISKIVRITLIVFAVLIGVTSAGLDLSLFAIFGGAIGLGIGFGLQKGVSNLFSGMLLLMDKSIKPGDVIELPDMKTFGTVNNMAARYTEIVTRDNKSLLIPNEDFITQRVVNWSHGNSLIRVHLPFGVHYKSDPHLVTKVAIEAATKPERVVAHPAPVCWIIGFGDSSIDFDLRFWIKDAEKGVANVRGMVFLALWDAFKEHGIEIPYPHREVYLHNQKD